MVGLGGFWWIGWQFSGELWLGKAMLRYSNMRQRQEECGDLRRDD